MDDISRKSAVTAACRCGWAGTRRTWTTIDATQYPERRRAAGQGTLLPPCPECGQSTDFSDPLLVLVRGSLPTFLMFADEDASADALRAVPENLAHGRHVAFVLLPPWSKAEVLTRDLERDLRKPKRALQQVRERLGAKAAENYRWLLEEVSSQHRLHRLMRRLDDLVVAPDEHTFERLIRADPHVRDADVRTRVERDVRHDANDRHAGMRLALLDDLALGVAYTFEQNQSRVKALGEQLVAFRAKFESSLEEASDPARRILLIDDALKGGLDGYLDDTYRALLLSEKGSALSALATGSRRENIEQAIACYLQATHLPAPTHEERANHLANLATVYGQRLVGDPPTNRATALELLEEALGELDNSTDEDLLAATRTNLALMLHDAGGPTTSHLRRALTLLEQALAWRSPERDVNEWGYSQANLAVVLTALAHRGETAIIDAEDAYRRMLRHADEFQEGWMIAQAQLNLAGLLIAEDEDVEEEDDPLADADRREATTQACTLLEDAAARASDRPELRGRVLTRLADVRKDLELPFEEHLREALEILVVRGSATEVVDAAFALASIYTQRSDWANAVVCYRLAVDHHELAASSFFAGSDRNREVRRHPQLARWAAHALAQIGELREAVETLERGRTYELRRRLPPQHAELDRLRDVDPELAEDYVEVVQASASAPLNDTRGAIDARRDEVLTAVRAIDGFEDFAVPTTFSDVRRAAAPGHPIVYINPTPSGTDVLLIQGDGEVSVHRLSVTSREIVGRVLVGRDFDEPFDELDGPTPSLALASAADADYPEDADYLEDALDAIAGWVGRAISAPLSEHFAKEGVSSATLIVCGPSQRLPFLTVPLSEDGMCLLDRGTFSLAASASLHAASRDRMSDAVLASASRLSFIGDPSTAKALPGAQLERVAMSKLGWRSSTYALGRSATEAALRAALSGGGTVHLACHARSDLGGLEQVGIELADASPTLGQIAEMDASGVRLVTLSACETALTPLDQESEAFSVAAVLQAAGAVGVVASLWTVDDVSTALLMSRFYEVLLGESRPAPAAALRDAQLWLRSLPRDHLAEALATSPALGVIEDFDAAAADPERPFAHLSHWGGFVAYGV